MDHTIVDDMAESYALEPQEVRALKTLQKGDGYSEAYLRLPQQRGGVIRIIADHYTRWAAEQQDPQVKHQLQQIMDQQQVSIINALDIYAKEKIQHA